MSEEKSRPPVGTTESQRESKGSASESEPPRRLGDKRGVRRSPERGSIRDVIGDFSEQTGANFG